MRELKWVDHEFYSSLRPLSAQVAQVRHDNSQNGNWAARVSFEEGGFTFCPDRESAKRAVEAELIYRAKADLMAFEDLQAKGLVEVVNG